MLGAIVTVTGCVTQARNYGGAQANEDVTSAGNNSLGVTETTPAAQSGVHGNGIDSDGVNSNGVGGGLDSSGDAWETNGGGSVASEGDDTGTQNVVGTTVGASTGAGESDVGVPHSGPDSTSSPAPSTNLERGTDASNSSDAVGPSPTVNPPDETSAAPSSSEPSTGPTSSTGPTTSTDTTPTVPAVDEYFVDWPDGKEPLEVGKQAAAIFTSKSLPSGSGHSNTDDYKHYKDACAWYGALSVALVAGERLLIDSLVAKYEPYKGTWGAFNPPTSQNAFAGSVDDSLFGIVPLAISKFRSEATYVDEGDLAADHQIAFIEQQKRYTSDDMFMITALQVQAYLAITDDAHRKRHLDIAAATMVEYLEEMQRSDGLIPHHLDREDYAIAWSRGNGWFAAGMAELIRVLPSSHRDYGAISEGYTKMMNGLIQYQVPPGQSGAGLWKQVVDSSDSRNWPETSGSAMFTYALVSGVRAGLLDVETFGPAARNAWIALVGQLNSNGEIQNISDWAYLPESHGLPANQYAGDEENYYFRRGKLTGDGHGQSPLMWAAAALTRPLD